MTPDQLAIFQEAVAQHRWPLVAALIIGAVTGVLKRTPLWAKIPRAYQAWVPLGLGVVSGIANALIKGVPWQYALLYGVASGLLPIGGDQVVSKPAEQIAASRAASDKQV